MYIYIYIKLVIYIYISIYVYIYIYIYKYVYCDYIFWYTYFLRVFAYMALHGAPLLPRPVRTIQRSTATRPWHASSAACRGASRTEGCSMCSSLDQDFGDARCTLWQFTYPLGME